MSYNIVKEKLDNGKLVILDGAMGSELEKNGAQMDKKLWCGTSSIKFPEIVKKVHEDYIEAGADVITTNTYASTPISMKNYGFENSIEEYNKKSVLIAKKAVENSNKDIAIAGSVSASGSFYKLGIKTMIPNFNEQLKILTGEGVDLIILEAMSSQAEIVQAMIECSTKVKVPVWLAISCVIDNNSNEIMLGYNDSMDTPPKVYENFEKSLKKFSQLHKNPILIAHSNIDVTGKAIKIAKKNFNGIIGAYPNVGFYEKPHWIYEDNMKPEDFLIQAKSWVESGSQIIGGCCGIGPDLIKSLSNLKL
tara:strand:- start:282 stop:1199 length:918 start_codon:yes stop_codon:yes gene_type:complete